MTINIVHMNKYKNNCPVKHKVVGEKSGWSYVMLRRQFLHLLKQG